VTHRVITAGALFFALGSPTIASAGGFEVPDQSAVAGAMGGAGTARRGDPSSAWYNPAELADGDGVRAGLGILLAFPTITAEGIEEPMETSTTDLSISPPPHLHLSYSENEWALGLYVGLSHGSSVHWPEAWWGRFESLQTSLLGVRANPFFALRLGGEEGLIEDFPDVRVSLGAHVDIVRLEQERALDFIDEEGRVHLLLGGAGVGGDASVYWQATEQLGVGFTYKSRTFMRLNGDADFTVPDPFLGRAPDQRASAELVIPDRLSLGAAWQQPEFAVFLDLGLTLWSVRQSTNVDFEREVTSDIDTPVRWHDSAVVRVGAEASPLPWLHARAGFFYDMEVGPDDTLAASSPDMARVGATFGVGVDLVDELGVDLYYSYVAFVGRESTSLDAALARYSGEIHIVGLTLRLLVDMSAQVTETVEPAPARDDD